MRPSCVLEGRCQALPNVLLSTNTATPLNTLNTFKLPCTLIRCDSRKRLPTRRSSRVIRSANIVPGLIRGAVAVDVQATLVPQAARLRPSDGTIAEFGTA